MVEQVSSQAIMFKRKKRKHLYSLFSLATSHCEILTCLKDLLLLLHHLHHLLLHHVKTQTRVMVDTHQHLRRRVSMVVVVHIRHLVVVILSRLPLIPLLKQHPMLLLLHKLNPMPHHLHNPLHMLHHLFNQHHPLHLQLLHHQLVIKKKEEASSLVCLARLVQTLPMQLLGVSVLHVSILSTPFFGLHMIHSSILLFSF